MSDSARPASYAVLHGKIGRKTFIPPAGSPHPVWACAWPGGPYAGCRQPPGRAWAVPHARARWPSPPSLLKIVLACASPRLQLSCRGWRTTASTRRCTSGVGGPGGNRRATASLRHRPVPRSPERSSGLDRPGDRNARRAIAGVVEPLVTPLPRMGSRRPGRRNDRLRVQRRERRSIAKATFRWYGPPHGGPPLRGGPAGTALPFRRTNAGAWMTAVSGSEALQSRPDREPGRR